MGGYILNFTVYTMAMAGLICFALFIYKKIMSGDFNTGSAKQLVIEETLPINPRKSLIIVRSGDERFLLASDIDKTTLISKLEDNYPKYKSVNCKKSQDAYEYYQTKKTNAVSQGVKKAPASGVRKSMPVPIKNATKNTIKKQPVHLQVISSKNPALDGLRRNSYTSRNYGKNPKINIEVGKSEQHGLSTMREMAAKVNEL